MAIFCRNTTEALNHLAYRLRLSPDDVVVTTVVEHHANLLPWGRVAARRYVECTETGTFTVEAVTDALDAGPTPPALLAVTGASNVTGWVSPVDDIIEAAHARGVRVVVDAAQLAPHRPLPAAADFVAFSGHKLYAPFGSGALIGPRSLFETGDPFLAGGGAVDLVGLDEVVWTAPPDREEAGSPNVIGAVALHAAIDALGAVGWDAIADHEHELARRLTEGLRAIDGVRLLGPMGSTAHQPAPGAGRDAAGGCVHRRRDAPCPGGGPPERRVRGGRPPRVLLRPPLRGPASRGCPSRWCTTTGTRCSGATTATCRVPFGPVRVWARRGGTSRHWWRRWRTWPQGRLPRSPTNRTRAPVTTSRLPSWPAGGTPAPNRARRARGAEPVTHRDPAGGVSSTENRTVRRTVKPRAS